MPCPLFPNMGSCLMWQRDYMPRETLELILPAEDLTSGDANLPVRRSRGRGRGSRGRGRGRVRGRVKG